MTTRDVELLICRVCIQDDAQKQRFTVFNKHEDLLTPGTSSDYMLIAEKLTACADIKITKDDGLPNSICSSCLLELENAYNFRLKCEKSDAILRIASITNPNSKCPEIPVKEESEFEYEYIVSDDDATHTQSEDIKPNCEESPIVEDFKREIKVEQQVDKVVSTFGVPALNNTIFKSKNLELICHDCDQKFKSKCKLHIHLKREHSKLPIVCTSCNLQFKSYLAYHNHQKNRPKTCISMSNLRIEGVGVSRFFYCKSCQYSSKNANNALQHLLVHTNNNQHKCDQCDRAFLRLATLRAHKERVHKQYYGQNTCHICGLTFRGFTLYESHMRQHREKTITHCQICNKTFTSKSSLYIHKKTHSESRSFACEKCPAKFYTSAILYSHKMTVHCNSSIACKVCGYKVKNPYVVKKHENKHDHSNVACQVCGKFFFSDTELALHKKVHKERNHPCDHCDKTYTARKCLTEHLRKAHKIYISSSDLKQINVKKKKKIKTDPDK